MMKRLALTGVILTVVASIGFVAYKTLALPIRLIVRNSTGVPLGDVHLTIRSKDGSQTIECDVHALESGREVVVRHRMSDASIDVAESGYERVIQSAVRTDPSFRDFTQL